jgi:hypothetical protein
MLVAICLVGCASPRSSPAQGRYGISANLASGSVAYPSFQVTFLAKSKTPKPRVFDVYSFAILDSKTARLVCQVTITMSGIVLESEFEVDGEKYVLAMTSIRDVTVWDEDSAKRNEPGLLHHWGKNSKWPNKALQPTTMSVTDRAAARSAPTTVVAEL